MAQKYSTRKSTPEARRERLARRAVRAMKYGKEATR